MNTPFVLISKLSARCLWASLGAALVCASAVQAQTTYYWDGNGATTGAGTSVTGTWGGASASAFWGTVANGTGATTAATIASADTVVFTAYDGTPANNPTGGYTVTLGAAQSVAGIVIGTASDSGNDGQITLAGAGANTLTIGAGGVTLAGSSFDPTISVGIILAASQTWNINNGHIWSVSSAVAGAATTGNTFTWTLGYVGAYTPTYSGVISDGAGGGKLALTLNNTNGTSTGGGTTYLSNTANTYTGKTTIARGILQVRTVANAGSASSLGAATGADGIIDMGSGTNSATLIYNGASATSTNRVINLAGTTGGATLTNSSSTANTVSFTGGVTNAGGGAKTLTLNGSNTGANTVGVISDAADTSKTTVSKSGAGSWVLSGDNTFTGGLTVSAGSLTLSNVTNHFDGVISVSGVGTLLNLNGATNFTKGMNVTGGTVIISASGALGQDVAGNNIVVNGGNLSFNADSGFTNVNRSITITSGGIGIGVGGVLPTYIDNTATGVVLGLNLVGTAGITGLTGQSYLGSFTGGTFTGTSLTAGTGSTYRIGGGGGTIVIQNNVLTGANNLLVGGTGGGTVTLSNGNTYTGTTTLQNGTLNVSSINSVSGGSSSSSLGAAPTTSGAGTITLGSGANAVAFNYTGAGETTDRILNFAGTTGTVTLSNSGTGAVNYSSAPTFTGAGSKTLALGATTDTLGGSIGGIVDNSGTNKTSVTKQGLTNSTWTLNGTTGSTGTNTYTGTTTITGGVLSVTGSAADPLANSYLNLNGSLNHLAVLQGQGTFARTLSGTVAAANFNWGTFGGFAAKGGTLTVTANGGAGLTWGSGSFMGAGGDPLVFGSATADNQVIFTNDINLNTPDAFSRVVHVEKGVGGDSAKLTGVLSPGTGPTGLTKTGAGTLILAGNNTYTGVTSVSAGKLLINGDQTAATGATTVSSTATLGGAGIVGSAVTVNSGAFLRPGATETGTGLLTFSNSVTLASGSTVNMQVDGSATRGLSYSAIDANGPFFGQGTGTGVAALAINFSSSLTDGAVLDLFGGLGFVSVSSAFSSVTLTGIYTGSLVSNGLSGIDAAYVATIGGQTLSLNNFSGDLTVTGTFAIPEPATYAAFAGAVALAGVACLRRRRRTEA
jgi:fibronectin-binding autotransporter adhesin